MTGPVAPGDAIPAVSFQDMYGCDPLLRALLRRWLGEGAYEDVHVRFSAMGRVAADATPLSALADKQRPRLVTHDARGTRVDRVEYHPAYRALVRMAYGAGVVGVKYEDAFLSRHRPVRHLVGFTLGYLFGETELSLYCPICMTDGVGRVLERHAADDPVAQDTIRHLASTDPAGLWQGAMFLTERQGGSDVGANVVQARQEGGRWFLSGEKWFCSNVDAEAILVLARMPGEGVETGTRGLGLFLVLRHRPADNGARIRIHRLKDKLGVASMATGEVTLEDVEAYLIGGAGEGFKQMAEMLNLSRLYNSVAAVAAMRRATIEALAYGRGREAFGSTLDGLPLWRASMADLIAETLGALLLVFETVRRLDAADNGSKDSESLVRLLTPTAKAVTGKLTTFTVSECMELVGGNAYIEEHIMPRLLRDAQVLPIWEGTTNILALDALRAMAKTDARATLHRRITQALATYETEALPPLRDAGLLEGVRSDVRALEVYEARMAKADPDDQQRAARGWIDRAARTLTKALLLEASTFHGVGEVAIAAARRIHARSSPTQPVAGGYSPMLDGTEGPLLDSWLA